MRLKSILTGRRPVTVRPSDVAAVLVTRGDVDLTPIIDTLPYDDVVIWDNSRRPTDLVVYGRYAAIQETDAPYVYVQDDDCLVRCHSQLLANAQAGAIVANMPEERWQHYKRSALLGWGALFERHLPFRAFERFKTSLSYDEAFFLRECDLIFAALTPCLKHDFGMEHLPHAHDLHRLYRQPGHSERRAALVEDLRKLQRPIAA